MPITAVFFLIGSMAIGGVPPFNGFVSEYIIYSGLFTGLLNVQGISQSILLILTITGLVMVGGMSLITFTKTFGVIFLGNPREDFPHEPKEASFIMLLPQYFIVAAMMAVALMPQFFFSYANKVVMNSFGSELPVSAVALPPIADNIANIGMITLIFMFLIMAVFGIRWLIVHKRPTVAYETWGCGYVAPVRKAQYSGRSFTKSFGQLFTFLVKEQKNIAKIPKTQIFPGPIKFATSYIDMLEKYLVLPLAKRLTFTLNYFQFIQNGQIQSYVLYGLFFIILIFMGTALNFIY